MNLHAHMPGQVTVQVPNQGSSKLTQQKGNSLASQMQNIAMDHELMMQRTKVQETIVQCLMKGRIKSSNPNAQWLQKIPELSRRLEERIFKDTSLKEDYMSLTMEKIEQQIQVIAARTIPNNSQQSSYHNISSSSANSTMMPTPGMLHSGGTLNSISSMNNSMMNTSGSSMSLLPTANGSVGGGNIVPFNASNGPNPNGYQQLPVNIAHNSGANNIIRESSQMMPTPGLNNPQSMSINSDYSLGGGGLSNIDSALVSQQPQQKQYVGSQNNHLLQTLEGQRGGGMRSNMQLKPSAYGLPNGVLNGNLGLVGSNMQTLSSIEAPEGYPSTNSYGGSTKTVHQHFDRQHHQQVIPTSMSQQLLPMSGQFQVSTADNLSDPRNIHASSSSVASSVNISQKVNSMSLHSKPKTNHTLLNHHASLQSSQQTSQIKPQMFGSSQHMNFQSSQPAKEHLVHPQNQMPMQNFQHQQFHQSNQPYDQLGQQQHQRNIESHQNHQLIPSNDNLRQTSSSSRFGEQFIQDHGINSFNESFLPQSSQLFQLSELQNQYQQTLSGSQDFQPSFSQGQANESHNDFSRLLNESQMADKMFDEFHQRISGQDEAQQPQISSDPFMSTGQLVSITQNVTIPQYSSAMDYNTSIQNLTLAQKTLSDEEMFQFRKLKTSKCLREEGSVLTGMPLKQKP